jgi:hypothetical protein
MIKEVKRDSQGDPTDGITRPDSQLRVCTDNVEHFHARQGVTVARDGSPEAFVCAALLESQADVIVMQETHAGWEAIFDAALPEYTHKYHKETPGCGGLSVRSKSHSLSSIRLLDPAMMGGEDGSLHCSAVNSVSRKCFGRHGAASVAGHGGVPRLEFNASECLLPQYLHIILHCGECCWEGKKQEARKSKETDCAVCVFVESRT